MLQDVLTYVVRLEYRLEQSGVFQDGQTYRNAELRFALEHEIEIDRDQWRDDPVSAQFSESVSDWMEANEDNPDASFVGLANHFSADGGAGKPMWPKLLRVLQFFALTGQWESMISKVQRDGHPAGLKHVTENPFKDED